MVLSVLIIKIFYDQVFHPFVKRELILLVPSCKSSYKQVISYEFG